MQGEHARKFASRESILQGLGEAGYICTREIATMVFLACRLEKPILVEGPAGVGKTELAKAAAALFGLPLIRLQCYEGLDESKVLYEWKYGKQLLYTQILRDKLDDIVGSSSGLAESVQKLHQYDDMFFSPHFLEPRPLLRALQEKDGVVLLVDEVDKADQEFEAFLLEVLSDFQISIPEIGTINALSKPLVFLTSNNTREMSDALKRRCLHLFIPFPDPKMEREIVRVHVPGLSERLRTQLVSFIQQVRDLDLKKAPSVGEAIDWAMTLALLHADILSPDLVRETLNTVLKFQEDIHTVEDHLLKMTQKALSAALD
jgi:MoxR-like ATPase